MIIDDYHRDGERRISDGHWNPAIDGSVMDVHDSATGRVIAQVPDGKAGDVVVTARVSDGRSAPATISLVDRAGSPQPAR